MIKSFLLFIALLPVLCVAQVDVCRDPVQAQVWESSPVRAEAVRLSQKLESRGLKVECMRRSKEEHLFERQKGAAWIKTNQGIFEAWFLPKGEDFDKLEVEETVAQNGRHLYSFHGLPHVPPTIDSSQPIVFIKNGDVLLEVYGNEALAVQLRRSVVNVP